MMPGGKAAVKRIKRRDDEIVQVVISDLVRDGKIRQYREYTDTAAVLRCFAEQVHCASRR